jgi:hypothetical protein
MSLAPFCTWFTPEAGMSQSEIQKEISQLYQRQKLIDAVARGEASASDLCELLAEHMIDVDQYVEDVVENVEMITGVNLS